MAPKNEEERLTAKHKVRNYYKKTAVKELQQLIKIWSKKMDLHPKDLSFRLQKSKWGSCGSNGHISLNWGLITCPFEVMEYVVIHELAHLKHQNHSKRFWALVESFCPDYKQHKKWLKNNNYVCDFHQTKSQLHI